ncbi:MAG: polyhydroxyalkanoic acid system family protein [Pirellulales bacterium]|nr:polyhydroxyalkanoic acid system family protein [Pirellulales bacterium]
MPKISVTVPHTLDQPAALRSMQNLVTQTLARSSDRLSGVQHTWVGNLLEISFKAMGFDISGQLQVEPKEVHVTGQIPLAAYFFQSQIEGEIRQQLQRALTPAQTTV